MSTAYEVLSEMPPRQRIIELIGAILSFDPDAHKAALCMASCTAAMAIYLTRDERIAVAQAMRDGANKLDVTVH